MNRKTFFFIILTAVVLVFLGVFYLGGSSDEGGRPDEKKTSEKEYVWVDKEEVKGMTSENQNNPDFQIIDLRTEEEFSLGHIAGAVNLDLFDFDFLEKLDALDRKKTYLLYCKTNVKSNQAAEVFKEFGFKNVYVLREGYAGWVDSD